MISLVTGIYNLYKSYNDGKEKKENAQRKEQYKNELEQVKNLITSYKNLDSKLSTVIGCLEKTIDNLSNGGYILDGSPYKKKELKEIISKLMAARNQIAFATPNLYHRQQELDRNIQQLGG